MSKIYIGAAILLIVLLAGWHYKNLLAENKQQAVAIDKLKTDIKQKDRELKRRDMRLQQIKAANQKLNHAFQAAREEVAIARKMFGDHNFANLAAKKPGLISIKMQKATERIFRDIERLAK